MKIRSEDGVEIGLDELAYDYYTMKPGYIRAFDNDPREDVYHSRYMQGSVKPWFTFEHTDGSQVSLNGQRIVSIEAARRKGYKDA